MEQEEFNKLVEQFRLINDSLYSNKEKIKVTRDMSKEDRKKYDLGDWFLNRAKCGLCGDTITSTHIHDFRACSCQNLHVDGGSWYLKRNFREGEDSYEELSIPFDDVEEKPVKKVEIGGTEFKINYYDEKGFSQVCNIRVEHDSFAEAEAEFKSLYKGSILSIELFGWVK